jgi:hypothetical protein
MITLTIILAEVSLVLMVVISVIAVRALRRRRRDQDAVKTLVISIKANQPARVEKLAGMLKDSNHLSEDDALNRANELIKKQNKFYQDAIDLYFTRNNEVLSKLDSRLEGLLDQYQGLLKVSITDNTSVNPEAMEQFSKDIASLSKELEELRAENTTLSTQLKAAERELDQLGREYVSAFNKPKVDKAKDDKKSASSSIDDEQVGEDERGQSEDDTNIDLTNREIADETPESGEAQEATPESNAGEITVKTEEMKTDEPKPTPKSAVVGTETEVNSKSAYVDDSDEQNLFADLGLDELIGDHPGKRVAGGKTPK